jgi:hypothetical protein
MAFRLVFVTEVAMGQVFLCVLQISSPFIQPIYLAYPSSGAETILPF